jgi:hypothetical protein
MAWQVLTRYMYPGYETESEVFTSTCCRSSMLMMQMTLISGVLI